MTIPKQLKRFLCRFPIFLTASCFLALSMQVFILPAKFAPGGVSGLSSLIQTLSGFPAGFSLLIFNVPLVILAFFFIRKRFAAETLVVILMTSALTEIFRRLNVYQYQGDHFLAALAGGAMNGIAIGLLIRFGASSGGTDIIGMLIQKKLNGVSISWIIFAVNTVVVVLAGFLYTVVLNYDLTEVISIVLFSFITLFINSKCMEIIVNGFNSAVKFEVITTMPDELSKKIIETMHRGVTVIPSRGAFSNKENAVVVCVVLKRQVSTFRRLIKEIDPNAFAYSVDTREVMGNGFNG